MMNRFVILTFALLIAATSQAQKYNLQQSIDAGIANNIPVKQSNLAMEASNINRRQSRYDLLPNMNSNINHGINQGRSIDPFTNGYVNQQINYAGYGINSGVILFNGLNLQNNMKRAGYAYEASKMEWQQAKDNLTLDIILAYLQILTNEDIIASTTTQLELSKKQLERIEALDKVGAINPSQVTDIKGQFINDQLALINASTELETAKLYLSQLMNVPYSKTMQLERIGADELLASYEQAPEEIYQTALKQFARVKAAGLRKTSARYALKASKGELFPTITFNVNAYTNYSSAALNTLGKIPYNEQLNNNIFSSINIGLRIPIFNSFVIRNKIKLFAIQAENVELEEENIKLILRQQIEQASLQLSNSFERYKALLEQVAAYKQSFAAAEVRLNAGLGTTVDYLIAKNNMDRSSINLISAKYDFILRKKALNYYQGTNP